MRLPVGLPVVLAGLATLALVGVVVVALLLVLRQPGPGAGPGAPETSGEAGVSAGDGAPSVEVSDLKGVSRAAAESLQTWARPDLDYDEWWAALSPRLAPGARSDYAFTDPANLPELEIDLGSDVEERRGPSPDTATVFFSTSAGRFGVDMSRRGADGMWMMVRIVFPGQESTLR